MNSRTVDLMRSQPSVAAMWAEFARGMRTSPDMLDALRDSFFAGALFATFAILETIDDEHMSADDVSEYCATLEAELRTWIEHFDARVM